MNKDKLKTTNCTKSMIDFDIIYKTMEQYIEQQNEKDKYVLYILCIKHATSL